MQRTRPKVAFRHLSRERTESDTYFSTKRYCGRQSSNWRVFRIAVGLNGACCPQCTTMTDLLVQLNALRYTVSFWFARRRRFPRERSYLLVQLKKRKYTVSSKLGRRHAFTLGSENANYHPKTGGGNPCLLVHYDACGSSDSWRILTVPALCCGSMYFSGVV